MNLKAAAEAIIFASKGITLEKLAKILRITTEETEKILNELADEYNLPDHGVELKRLGDVYRFYTKAEYAQLVQSVGKSIYTKLSVSQLEIVAIIMINGPSTLQQISEIRGKDSSALVRSLHKMGVLTRKRYKNSYIYNLSQRFKELLMIEEVPGDIAEHLQTATPSPSSSEE
ncbi:chromosome segregation and condensation protein, ScpB [Pseudothermotoga thermarum DSM 5069]|uniref:Chromosome segregation and condensation protein, ScpB n=1 Tax=Pseudothermotoga thermarum DSM 5069 TaxID=688269 RepID=F7YXC9_9THEM|nr:chromosome segregation and condensation protein, ScpB [Pseudothermotoga thermarum DSM 5069]